MGLCSSLHIILQMANNAKFAAKSIVWVEYLIKKVGIFTWFEDYFMFLFIIMKLLA